MTNLEIEAFLAVVRLGSITAAAQAIFITQPALSRRLQTLEEELGYPLFWGGERAEEYPTDRGGQSLCTGGREMAAALAPEPGDCGAVSPRQNDRCRHWQH